jgi:hypothetical protein
VETALTLGNLDVLRELAWAKLAVECFDHERIELCRIASMNIVEISSNIGEVETEPSRMASLIVTGPHTIKRLDNGVTFCDQHKTFLQVENCKFFDKHAN